MSSFRSHSHLLQAKGRTEPKNEPPITFPTERAFVDDLKKLSKPLDGLTEEWTARVASLNRLQKIVLDGAHKKYPAVFLEHLNGDIRDGVIRQLGDSRSGVSVVAAQCIKTLAAALKEQLDVDPYAGAILRVMGTTNQVIKDAAHTAMIAVIENSRLGRASVVLLADTVKTSKNAGQRQRAAEYLRRVMGENARYGHGTLDKAVDEIEAAVKKALSDGDPNVRAEARLAFKAYCNVWSDRGSALLESLDPSVKKYLTPPSATAAAAAAAAASSLSTVKRSLSSQTVKPSTTTATKTTTISTATTTATPTAKATVKTSTNLPVSKPSATTTTALSAKPIKVSIPTISSLSKSTAAALSEGKAAPALKQQPQPSTVVKKLVEKRHLPQAPGLDAKRLAVGSQKPTPAATPTSSTQKLHLSVTVPAAAHTVSRTLSTSSHPTIAPRVDISLAIKYGAKDNVELKRKAITMLKQAIQGSGNEENKDKDSGEKPPQRKRDPRVAINIASIASLLKATLTNEACNVFEEETLAVVLGLFEGYAGEAAYHLDDILAPVFTRLSKNSENSELCERILEAALSGVKIDQLLSLARKLVLGRGSGPGLESYAVLVFLEKVLEQSPESFGEFQRTKTLALSLASILLSSSPQALKDKASEVLRKLYGLAKDDFVRALKTLSPNVYANTVKHLPFIEPEVPKDVTKGNDIEIEKNNEGNKNNENVNVDNENVILNMDDADNEGKDDGDNNEKVNGVVNEDENMNEPEDDVKCEEKDVVEMNVDEDEKIEEGEEEAKEAHVEAENVELKSCEETNDVEDVEMERVEQEESEEAKVEEPKPSVEVSRKPPSTPQILKEKAMGMLHSLSGSDFMKSIKSFSASVVRHLPFMDSKEPEDEEESANEPKENDENVMVVEGNDGASEKDVTDKSAENADDVSSPNDNNEKGNETNEGGEYNREESDENESKPSENDAEAELNEESAETTARVEKIASALKTATEKFHKKCPDGFGELSALIESKPFLSEQSASTIALSLSGCLSPTQNAILRRTALQHLRSFATTFFVPVPALKEAFTALIAVIGECEAAQGDEDRTLSMANNTLRALETARPTELLLALLEVCGEQDGSTPLGTTLHTLGGLFARVDKSVIEENEERIAGVLAVLMGSDAVEIRKETVFCIGECCIAHPERERFEKCVGELLTPVQMNTVHHYIDRKKH